MNGYFFAASTTSAQLKQFKGAGKATTSMVQSWSGRDTLLFWAETLEAAQTLFDASMAALSAEENPREIKVHEVMVAQLVGELLTEAGGISLDLPEIARQVRADVEATPEDYFEQGYWLDLREVDRTSPTQEALRQALPEETRSGLNWQVERQFFFLFSVLSPPAPFMELVEEPLEEPEAPPADDADSASVEAPGDEPDLERFLETENHPKLAPMETAVMVRARNAAVAAWLWHRYAADTRLAGFEIAMETWNGVGGINAEPGTDDGTNTETNTPVQSTRRIEPVSFIINENNTTASI